MDNETKAVGKIIKVHKTGWGFISSRDIEFTRIFFHWTALKQDTLRFPELRTGMYVEFTALEIPGKGYRAMNIRVVEKPHHETETTDELSTLQESSEGSAGAA